MVIGGGLMIPSKLFWHILKIPLNIDIYNIIYIYIIW